MPTVTQSSVVYEGGFSDPVVASQAVFRALMDAMARPGSVHALPDVTAPLSPDVRVGLRADRDAGRCRYTGMAGSRADEDVAGA